ncbi:MAG: glutathione synthetase [Catalinimonas sp.]
MTIGFVINDVLTEKAGYTTVFLAMRMHNRGHRVYLIGVGDLCYDPSGQMGATARRAPDKKFKDQKNYLTAVQGDESKVDQLVAADLDVLMLRNDPAAEPTDRTWAQISGVIFGQLAAANGVIVVNDPNSLSDAVNKMYFQHFPEKVRPRTLITRNPVQIRDFFKEQHERMILKPLQGSGGQGVFVIEKENATNLNQIIEAISRDGYVIAQEFLPAAAEGDVRLFLMNGRPIEHKGKIAAMKRVGADDDVRNNVSAGGHVEKVKITDAMLDIVEVVRPKLVQDGMFFVGLDIAGDKLMEINVFSPGGLNISSQMEKTDFAEPVIDTLEQKVYYRKTYGDKVSNRTLAMM